MAKTKQTRGQKAIQQYARQIARKLVEAANRAGGRDNIAVVVARIEEGRQMNAGSSPSLPSRGRSSSR